MKISVFFLFLVICLIGCSNHNVEINEETKHNYSFEESFESNEEISSETEEDVPYVGGWTPDFKPSDFETMEEYEKAFLDELVKQFEPTEIFETEKDYPYAILEIFDIIMEKETYEFLKCEELLGIEILGDENEFFVSYQYITKEGVEEYLNIRVCKIEDGKYGLLGRGGGAPLGHGLEMTELSLDDIK